MNDSEMKREGYAGGNGYGMAGLLEANPELMVNMKELAGIMGVVTRTIRRMTDRCDLPQPFRVGRMYYWQVGNIVEWLKRRADAAAKESEMRLKKIQQFA